jgi:DNA-binding MarR family transcriptional regulator
VSADTSAQTQPDHPGQPEDSGLLVIGSWAAVLADLAPTLKEAELRVLLELSRRQLRTPSCVAASGREIANACKLGRRNVQYALDSLAKRNLISTRQGTAAARAAPYEKGTETKDRHSPYHSEGHAARAAPYEKGTETCDATPLVR